MRYRALGQSGLRVSEIGFGAWGIGGRTDGTTSYGDTDDAVSRAALKQAADVGITFFDTSSVYGYGHSERLIGEALGSRRNDVVIATKAGYARWTDAPDFSPDAVRRSVAGSLERLATDRIDLLQLHNPPPALLDARPEILGALDRLRGEGAIGAVGISVKRPEEGLAILDRHAIDAIQVNLNMMDLRAVDSGLLDRARDRGVGIIARTPLCFGFLSGAIDRDTTFPEGDHRNGWSAEQLGLWIDGAEALFQAVPPEDGEDRASVALRYCLSFEAVSCVIPGILTPEEATRNAAVSARGTLTPSALRRVSEINDRMTFFAPRRSGA